MIHPVKSSTVVEVGHDGTALLVRFTGGALYRYPGVSAAHVDALKGHDSPGAYFREHVRRHHKGERVEE